MGAVVVPENTVPEPWTHMGQGTAKRLQKSFVVVFLLAMLGIWIVTLTPVVVLLPLKVKALDPNPVHQGRSLSLILGVGAFVGIIANPLCGRLSDRTTSRLGMRRPWLLFAAVCCLVGFALLAVSGRIAIAVLGWSIAQVGINAGTAVLLALIPDQVPENKRGTVSGLVGLSQALAGVIGTALVAGLTHVSLTVATIVPAALAGVFLLVAVVCLRDRVLSPGEREPFGVREFAHSFWVDPRRQPDFGWAWLSRFAIFMAVSMVLNYQIFYLTQQLGVSPTRATSLVTMATGLQSVIVVVVSLVFGPLSDRLGRRKIFVMLAALLSAAGIGVLVAAPARPSSSGLFLLAVCLVALGQGVYFAVDLALVTDVLPNSEKDAAKDLGVLGLAQLVPQALAPTIAPLFLMVPLLARQGVAQQNYTILYLGGLVFAVVSALTVLRVKAVR